MHNYYCILNTYEHFYILIHIYHVCGLACSMSIILLYTKLTQFLSQSGAKFAMILSLQGKVNTDILYLFY